MNAAELVINTPDLAPTKARGMAKLAPATNSSAAHAAADAAGIIREWGKVYDLTATECTTCGSPLRDAVSVTRGIGPVCSAHHYEINFDITADMVEDALGILFASNLETPVKLAAKALKEKPRDLCNILIWWSSAHLDNTEVVLDCASIVTALGFVTLGDKMRERNTNIIVSTTDDDSGDFILRCRSKMNVRSNMRKVTEASSVARDGRFKYGWRFPASRKALVWTILGEDFGDQWATVPGKDLKAASQVVKVPPTNWLDVRSAFRATYDPPKPVEPAKPLIVRPGDTRATIEVYTPFRHFGFIADFKGAIPYNHGKGYSWNREKGCWVVESRFESKVRSLVADHFGDN